LIIKKNMVKNMNIYKNDVKYQIAQKLFEYYVINDKYVAVQMPDEAVLKKLLASGMSADETLEKLK